MEYKQMLILEMLELDWESDHQFTEKQAILKDIK